ncbi:MAG: glycoside hydrolase family 32 protein [Brachybacterium tyrofermentans]|uniref:Glycoside hydrolase family 32 protein n=1 Tax=Brachybacterium tyrofermentans TaxID=47848 RepID=A0ABW0FMN3_9MICO
MTITSPSRPRTDQHRPRFHLTPEATWMNDPNGLIRHDGAWHAFFQNNPFGSTWGNMSWGHAVSEDLATWTHLPVALPCSETEMIFSGSIVHDAANTSGLGAPGEDGPLVAFYTSAYTPAHATTPGIQAQSIAFSLDGGTTWDFYAENPVLTRDSENFRDPKVFFHPESGRWVMVTVEALDHAVHLHTSADLLTWEPASTVTHPGLDGGIWECPDLLRVQVAGADGAPAREAWVLVISTNPGGPAGGSGTYAVIGDFDGTRFASDTSPVPLDLGQDCYAAVSFSGVDGDPVLLGWMNNWAYAEQTPTAPWRSAMTLPRTLHVEPDADGTLQVIQHVIVPEGLRSVDLDVVDRDAAADGEPLQLDADEPFRLRGTLSPQGARRVVLRFGAGQAQRELVLGLDPEGHVVLDRGRAHLEPFAADHSRSLPYIPRAGVADVAFDLVVDRSCVDLELDGGRALVSQQIFPAAATVAVHVERSA